MRPSRAAGTFMGTGRGPKIGLGHTPAPQAYDQRPVPRPVPRPDLRPTPRAPLYEQPQAYPQVDYAYADPAWEQQAWEVSYFSFVGKI